MTPTKNYATFEQKNWASIISVSIETHSVIIVLCFMKNGTISKPPSIKLCEFSFFLFCILPYDLDLF